MEKGFIGPISHLGDMIPVMTGILLGARMQKKRFVAVAYIGDGGMSTGAFHEGLNFAAVQTLPLVVVAEDNKYAYSTPIAKQMTISRIDERAAAYGIHPSEVVNAIEANMRGKLATQFVAFDRKVPIMVRLPEEDRQSLITLQSLRVAGVPIGELRAGVLAAVDLDTRDRRLAMLTRALEMDPVPIDQVVAEAWASLRVSLRDLGLRMPVNDSWITATAIALGLPLVTQDEDYLHAPGLEVIHI